MDYNGFLNGNYKLLKIALYKLPSEQLDGSILMDKRNGAGLEQYVEKYMHLIVAEENLTNYLVLESQSNQHILLDELLAFSNVLLDNTISEINSIIHEGSSKSFFDYFYYSFVVITTLGFGDITPVSQLFRVLTVLEAFLGLIIMGLFLAKAFESKK
ncbi:Ion channel [compost metagenome]